MLVTVGVGSYLLHGPHTPARYPGPAKSSARAAPANLTCARPSVIPIDHRDAQSGVAKSPYYITNDTWNASHYSGVSQTLHVCDYSNWYAVASMNNDTFDGAVKTSPNVQETWQSSPAKISSLESISSRFSDVPPGVGPDYGIWEFEYDIWLNGLADSNSTEIMIWTYNNGRKPGGSLIGSFTENGHAYNVYRSGPPYQYIAFVDQVNNQYGQVNLLDFFRFVIAKGWIPSSSKLRQICNGVEIVSTNDHPEKFSINNFSIDMAYRSAPAAVTALP
jgi:hypothetical protein